MHDQIATVCIWRIDIFSFDKLLFQRQGLHEFMISTVNEIRSIF